MYLLPSSARLMVAENVGSSLKGCLSWHLFEYQYAV